MAQPKIVTMYSLDPSPTVRGTDGKFMPDTSGKPKIIKHTFQFFDEKDGSPSPKYQRYLNRGYTFEKPILPDETEPATAAPLYVSEKDKKLNKEN